MNDQRELSIKVDGEMFVVNDEDLTLLDFLRSHVGITSVKDGCSPQGQCGCCTVLVDGQARVSCVTPVKRVIGREIETLEGLDNTLKNTWAKAFIDAGASQCGFCTPGIIMRFAALQKSGEKTEIEKVKRSKLPFVVILISGRPMIINEVLDQSDAFLAAWLPGTEGLGISDVIFGDFDFTGKLSMTWPKSTKQIPINYGDSSYDPLFKFGFGLSYKLRASYILSEPDA